MLGPVRPRRFAPRPSLGLLLAWLVATGCSDGGDVRAIEATRDVPAAGAVPDLASADRFGMGAMPAAAASAPEGLTWEVPAGWTEQPPTPPRLGSFIGPGGIDASITVLPGTAGGLTANVNRWRSQLGLAPWTEARIAALPRDPALHGEAVRVELIGDEAGADGSGAVGWILQEPGEVVFVKAVGPADALAAERDALDALLASLAHAGHDHGAHAAAEDPHAGVVDVVAGDPHAGLDPETLAGMAEMMGAGTSGSAGGLGWTAPEGWERAGERPMRLVTFAPGGRDDVECYVVVLGGGGGTVRDNVNRWRAQVGLGPLPPAEVDALATLEVLGTGATLVDAAEAGLLGVICPLPGRGVFVKMTGPPEVLAAERDRFLSFCRSLHE